MFTFSFIHVRQSVHQACLRANDINKTRFNHTHDHTVAILIPKHPRQQSCKLHTTIENGFHLLFLKLLFSLIFKRHVFNNSVERTTKDAHEVMEKCRLKIGVFFGGRRLFT